MRKTHNIKNLLAVGFLALILGLFVLPELAEARRGGRSFGGSRRSYSSKSRSRSSTKAKPKRTPAQVRAQKAKTPSFGGKRITPSQAKKRYGAPRNTSTVQGRNELGQNKNFVVHNYGGYGSSLARGYALGSITSTMMWLPWHGAFWYSRPYYHTNPNGAINVYPPTFNWGKVFFVGVVGLIIIFLIVRWIKKRRQSAEKEAQYSSFG